MTDLNEPLSDAEIAELDEFLISDATPDECMTIVELDGFLTSLAIGPELVMPGVWLKAVWGDGPVFESLEQAQRLTTLIMRRYNTIIFAFNEIPKFEPIIWEREVGGTTYKIVDDWCFGFMTGVTFSLRAWQPLLSDPEACAAMMLPILTLGSEEGRELLKAERDPDVAEQTMSDALASSVIAIALHWRERRDAPKSASTRPRKRSRSR